MGRSPAARFLLSPLALTQASYSTAAAIIAAFGRSLGCIVSGQGFDLWITEPVGPDAILGLHTDGDRVFHALDRGYLRVTSM